MDPQTQLLSYMIMNKPKTTNWKTLSNRGHNLRQISSQMPTMHRQPAGKQLIEDERLSNHSFDDPEVNQSAPDDQDWIILPCLPPRSDSLLTHHSSTQSLESFNDASQWERSHLCDKTTSEQLLMDSLKLSRRWKQHLTFPSEGVRSVEFLVTYSSSPNLRSIPVTWANLFRSFSYYQIFPTTTFGTLNSLCRTVCRVPVAQLQIIWEPTSK